MCIYNERRYRGCKQRGNPHTYIERAKCKDAVDGDIWHPRNEHVAMPGNVDSGMAIKCPHCNDLHYDLDQDNELDAADEAAEEEY